MKRKPIKIDWDELEAAFDNRREDLVYYLDLVTGQVILEGEGEEEDFEDGDEVAAEAAMGAGGNGRNATTRLYIEPPGPDEELVWIEDFARESAPNLTPEVERVIDADDVEEAIRAMFRRCPEHRDTWFAYRSDRLHQAIEAWIDQHEVRACDPPPWRG